MFKFLKNEFWLIKAPRYIIIYFIISVLLAGYFYISGEYSITNNFLSQLGQLYVKNDLNLISFIIFNLALIDVGIVLSLFYFNFYNLFKIELKDSKALKLLLFTGIFSGICFAGVGAFPTDIAFTYHLFFADSAFYCLLIVSVIQTYIIYNSKFLSNQYAIGYLIFCIFLGLYVRLLMFGGDPSIGMPDGYYQTQHVVSQKLIVLSILIATLHQTIGIEKYLEKNRFNV